MMLASAAFSATTLAEKAPDFSKHRAVLAYAELMTHPDSDEAGGIIVYQRDKGNGQLGADFVYNDPRRASFNGGEANVNFAVDDTSMTSDAGMSSQAFWMRDSVHIWNRETCSNMRMDEVAHNGNRGVVERYFEGQGINADWGADLTQVGFRSAAEFPAVFGGGSNILGVTFTLTWVDENGAPTDIDNNGKADVAFREIYYNDEYEWSDSDAVAQGAIDFPTVAIHEVGHGVSAAHFGMIAVKNQRLFAKPRAIMNAVYGGQLRDLTGRDSGSHCSNWAQWPNG
ncbi:hypothetical protein [Thalassotalea sp. G2M2-11]|uniref:hypothetical protein n=1 Tax=Thalassotalea sp. G2M2-11 TaxID=2787627 RepID=UPI0019D05F5D|nr:hypothetical protein [Thalassotalea sp. G2M2-11]